MLAFIRINTIYNKLGKHIFLFLPMPKIRKKAARTKKRIIVEKTVGYGCQVFRKIFFQTLKVKVKLLLFLN